MACAKKDWDTACRMRGLHIKRRIADKPNILVLRCLHTACGEIGQRLIDRGAVGLVARRVGCPHEAAEIARPAEMRRLAPQQVTVFVGDHAERHLGGKLGDQSSRPRQGRYRLEMLSLEGFVEDVARLLPIVAEKLGKRIAQRAAHALARFVDRPRRLAERDQGGIDGDAQRLPAIDERVVPIEQNRARPSEASAHAAPACRSMCAT